MPDAQVYPKRVGLTVLPANLDPLSLDEGLILSEQKLGFKLLHCFERHADGN